MPTIRPPAAGLVQTGAGTLRTNSRVSSTLRRKTIAASPLARPSRRKAGNSKNETIVRSGMMNAGKSPKWMRAMIAPVTEAMTIGANALSA